MVLHKFELFTLTLFFFRLRCGIVTSVNFSSFGRNDRFDTFPRSYVKSE